MSRSAGFHADKTMRREFGSSLICRTHSACDRGRSPRGGRDQRPLSPRTPGAVETSGRHRFATRRSRELVDALARVVRVGVVVRGAEVAPLEAVDGAQVALLAVAEAALLEELLGAVAVPDVDVLRREEVAVRRACGEALQNVAAAAAVRPSPRRRGRPVAPCGHRIVSRLGRATRDEPEQLLGDAAPEDALRREKREAPVAEREAHARAEDGPRAGARAVAARDALVQDLADEVEVLLLLRVRRGGGRLFRRRRDLRTKTRIVYAASDCRPNSTRRRTASVSFMRRRIADQTR